jgi:diadenosine tetraphosphate (Ap4A) HIT family hydrolase
MPCELCDSPGGDLVWQNALCRVVRVNDPNYPGFCRVILNRHLKEMIDLPESDRQSLMRVVFAVEQALTTLMRPEKINLASLGNLVPHVHWHIIPRFSDDAHFPRPIWAAPARAGSRRTAPEIEILRNTLDELL